MFKNDVKKENRLSTVLLILLVIAILVMRYLDSFLKTEFSPQGIVSFELAKELPKSIKIIQSWNGFAIPAAGLSLGFDFLFLLIYSSFIALLIYKINKKLLVREKFRALKIMVFLPFLAALFDILENISLIKLLLGDLQQSYSLMAFYFATTKFLILFITLVYLVFASAIVLFSKKN